MMDASQRIRATAGIRVEAVIVGHYELPLCLTIAEKAKQLLEPG